MRQVRATEKKQRSLGEAELRERLDLLRGYEEQLREGEVEQMRVYEKHAKRVLGEAAANLRPVGDARWVMR